MREKNILIISGRVAREVKTTAYTTKDGGNMKIIRTVVAQNNGNKASFFTIKIFASSDVRQGGKMSAAGYFESILKKGNRILVSGKLEQEEWEKDGEKHYETVIVANEIDLLSEPNAKTDETQTTGGEQVQNQTQQAPAQTAPAPAAPAQPEVPEGFLVIPTGADEELPF